jgi:hypothetical protein
VFRGNPGKGHPDTAPKGVTVVHPPRPAHPKPQPKPKPAVVVDKPCWLNFGGDPQRTSSRLTLNLGLPVKPLWVRALHGYVEYPPSYCQGDLYVNTFKGRTYAIDGTNGKVLWISQGQGPKPSTPAIAGDRVIVSSTSGTVTALARSNGAKLWQLDLPGAKVESSPVVIGNTAYFGATDGRLFAVNTANGHVKWAYNTGGRINSSPSILGNKIFITTYAGSILSLNRLNGHRNWITYIKRDFAQYESFYASASTDGTRLYTISRAGKVVAVRVSDGSVVWTHNLNTTGYSTPAIANGIVYVGDSRLIRLPRLGRHAAVADLHRRADPRTGRDRRPARVLLEPRDEDVRAAPKRRKDRVARRDGQVPAGHRDRPSLLLHAERAPRRLPGERSGQEESRGCRRRQAGERRKARLEAFHALILA